jgi:hypothetical protein
MKMFVYMTGLVAAIAVFFLSCTSGFETQGNSAYSRSIKATGESKRLLEKEAYIYYQKAVKSHPAKIGKQLRNRFIELTVHRATMVLTEGSSAMDALPLYMQDIDSVINPDVGPDVRGKYVSFLMTITDSIISHQRYLEALSYAKKAVVVAQDPLVSKKYDSLVSGLSTEFYNKAQDDFDAGMADKNVKLKVSAEYYAKASLFMDSTRADALELLSKAIKENIGTYSAYEAIITDKPDTLLYDKINKFDILLAVPTIAIGGSVVCEVMMYNYSYNPQRLRPENFSIVDSAGTVYRANSGAKIEKDILDQKQETRMKFTFEKPAAPIKKLVYENGEHYSEKRFY